MILDLCHRPSRVAALFVAFLSGPLVASATAQVTVPSDYSTIQAAINAVVSGARPSGTTITVLPGTYPETLFIGNTSRSLTIRGASGATATVVDAAGKGAAAINVYQVTGSVTIEGLTFRNAAANAAGGGFVVNAASPAFVNCVFEANTAPDGGGGALIASNATFTGCIFRNNSARHFGGGIYLTAGSRPVLTACTIVDNASGTGGPGVGNDGAGGGIFSHDSSPTIRGGRISHNTSRFAAGGIFHAGSYGAAIASLVIEDAEIADNVSTQFSSADNPSEGGGMHIEDNAIATLTRVRVLRNQANTGGGLNSFRARYDVVDSIIENNAAVPTASAPSTTGFGGGIAATSNNPSAPIRPGAVVNLTRTLVRGNSGPFSGGGVAVFGDNFSSTKASFTMSNSVVTSNAAQNQGGGVLVNRTNAVITNSMITSNTVTGGTVPFGGGIEAISNTSLTVSGTTIAGNIAGIYGGGVFVYDGTTFDIGSSRIYGNTSQAANAGGGIYIGGSTASGIVHDSLIADNTNFQISNFMCPTDRIEYRNNTITPASGANDIFVSGCSPTITDIGTFNAKSTASGNNSNVPRFAHFMAAPASGLRFRLAWSVGRATAVTISGVGTFTASTGSTEVAPSSSQTYSLTATATQANGGNYGPTSAGVTVVTGTVPPPSRTTASDFDGDSRADIVIFRPSTGTWYLRQSRSNFTSGAGYTWGGNGDVPVPGDYDGDRVMDFAVYRPSSGHWFILKSTTGYTAWATQQWGEVGDVPLPGDYDGDSVTDVMVYPPSTGRWYLLKSSTGFGTSQEYAWGVAGDRPAPGDYDGDGRFDLAVYRPATGHWFILMSTTGYTAWSTIQWGTPGDVLVPADYDGDRRTDLAVYRPSTGSWYVLQSGSGFTVGAGYTWGGGADIPVPGDYDGDGRADISVYRPSTAHWFLLLSTTTYTTWWTYQWGSSGDIAISPAGNSIR